MDQDVRADVGSPYRLRRLLFTAAVLAGAGSTTAGLLAIAEASMPPVEAETSGGSEAWPAPGQPTWGSPLPIDDGLDVPATTSTTAAPAAAEQSADAPPPPAVELAAVAAPEGEPVVAAAEPSPGQAAVARVAPEVAPVEAPAGPVPLPGTLGSPDAIRSWDLLNAFRAANGQPGLVLTGDAIAKAQAIAEQNAASGQLVHSTLFAGLDGQWMSVTENLGVGGTPDQIHDLLAAHDTHRDNMLSPQVLAGGVGAAFGPDGQLYLVQVLVG